MSRGVIAASDRRASARQWGFQHPPECVEGAETEGVRFHEATALKDEDIAAIQDEVHTRVLRLFRRSDLLSPDDAAAMRRWSTAGGFALGARVRIEPTDRKGLEWLWRYCARPTFASERLAWAPRGQRMVYSLPRPTTTGRRCSPSRPWNSWTGWRLWSHPRAGIAIGITACSRLTPPLCCSDRPRRAYEFDQLRRVSAFPLGRFRQVPYPTPRDSRPSTRLSLVRSPIRHPQPLHPPEIRPG
jgi:Putative transposase